MRTDRPAEGDDRIAFVDIGRALAACAVFYVHIDVLYIRERHTASGVTDVVESAITAPLGLSDLGLGQVGVCLFFLISGYVVTPIAMRMGGWRFAVNRFFRLYPLLVAAVLSAALLLSAGLRPITSPEPTDVTLGEILSNVTLINFALPPFGAFVGVAWTLAVEVLFYLLLIAMIPVLRRWLWLAIAVELELVFFVLLLGGQVGEAYRGLTAQAAYLLIPIVGQVLWAGWHRKLPGWLAGGYLVVAWLLLVWAAELGVDVFWALEPVAVALALLLFVAGLGVERRLRQRPVWTAASERSYSLYLVHGIVGLPVMHLLDGALPVPVTVLAGVVATGVAVQLTYLSIERPSHNLGRRLSRVRTAAVRSPRAAGRAGPQGPG